MVDGILAFIGIAATEFAFGSNPFQTPEQQSDGGLRSKLSGQTRGGTLGIYKEQNPPACESSAGRLLAEVEGLSQFED